MIDKLTTQPTVMGGHHDKINELVEEVEKHRACIIKFIAACEYGDTYEGLAEDLRMLLGESK